MVAALTGRRAAAEEYVEQLRAIDASINARIVPGHASCLDACDAANCAEPASVLIGTWCALTREPIESERCRRHGLGLVRLLLEDDHRRAEADCDPDRLGPAIKVQVRIER